MRGIGIIKKSVFRRYASDTGTGAKTEDKLDELAGLVKSLMQAQTERDQQREREASRQE